MPGSVEQDNGITIKERVIEFVSIPGNEALNAMEVIKGLGISANVDHVRRIIADHRRSLRVPPSAAPADVREIPLAAITVDKRVPFRDHVREDAVADYAEVWSSPDPKFPPVVLFRDGATHYLGGGLHRYLSADRAGLVSIKAEVREGTLRDAILFAAGDNVRNGIRKTRADKRAGVMALLRGPEFSGMTIEEIADHCDVSVRTVSNCKRDLNPATCKVGESEGDAASGEQGESDQGDASDRSVPSDDRSSAGTALDGPDDATAEDDIDDSMGANPEDDPEDSPSSSDAAPSASANGHPKGANGKAPEKTPVAGELSDDEWLATLTVRDKLVPASLKGFDADALLYRHLKESDPYGPFDRRARKLLDAKKIRRTGPFWSKLSWFLSIPHPRDWKACLNCRGTGLVGDIGNCRQCGGHGYGIV